MRCLFRLRGNDVSSIHAGRSTPNDQHIYLRQGGYVFASVSLCVCVCVFVCLCVINITQKVTDQFLPKF